MRITCLHIIAGLIAVASTAAAGPERSEPIVLAIDGSDIYVDLGARDGVGEGTQLELLHEITATDPTSGKPLRDRFALGVLAVTRSGEGTSIAHAEGELAKRVLVGDHLRLASARRTFVDPWAEQVEASKPRTAATTAVLAIDHAGLAREAWQATLGQPPEQRIERWAALLAADPQTTYRRSIELEIASLRKQVAARDAALAKAQSSPDDRSARIAELSAQLAGDGDLALASLDHVVPDRAIELAFSIRDPGALAHAFLYTRAPGAPGFARSELVRDGDAYLRGTIAAAAVREPAVAYYVEATSSDGTTRPVLGSAAAPRTIAVDAVVAEPPPGPGRSHVDLHVDYVDFDGKLGKGYDQYYQAEGDFMYRFLEPVYAVRLGFGSLSGIGGPKSVIDADPRQACLDTSGVYRCKRVTFSYVYSEAELRLRTNVALLVRPQIGVLTTDEMPGTSASRCQSRDTIGCRFLTGLGARVRVRLGEERGTNLVLGASFTRDVGTLLEAAYHWLPVPVVPVQITVQVTDQPVIDDFGVRLIGDVGYRRLGWFYPSIRVSYQARSLDHTGVSGGMAMNFDW
jgi:hypothetical protein